MKTFVCDVDGVLADFVLAFTTEANRLFGDTPIYGAYQMKTWNGFAGLSPLQVKDTWRSVVQSPTFWEGVPSLLNPSNWESLKKLNLVANVYFATSRNGNDVLHQTKSWLENYGVFRPNVVLSQLKGDFCRAVDADGAIDDNADNVNRIAWDSKATPFLLSRLYNFYDEGNIGSPRVQRINRITEYLDWCFEKVGTR